MPRISEADEIPFSQRVLQLMRQRELTFEQAAERADICLAQLYLAVFSDFPAALSRGQIARLADVLGATEAYLQANA